MDRLVNYSMKSTLSQEKRDLRKDPAKRRRKIQENNGFIERVKKTSERM
jgi:hypothetical protein